MHQFLTVLEKFLYTLNALETMANVQAGMHPQQNEVSKFFYLIMA